MLFPEENVIIMIYGGRPPLEMLRMSSLSLWAPTHCGWGHVGTGLF
jgi:hypothetical protein